MKLLNEMIAINRERGDKMDGDCAAQCSLSTSSFILLYHEINSSYIT